MILMRETTVWDDVSRQPNHTYLASDDKGTIYGYFKWNKSKDFQLFSKPMRIDTRRRTFKVLQKNLTFKTS